MHVSPFRISVINIAWLVCFTGLNASVRLAAQVEHTIYGTVRQPDGSPAKRATVDISGMSGMRMRTFADDLGRYEFSGILRGTYRITATNPADATQTMEPVDVDTSQFVGARIMVNLYLRFASKTEASKENPSPVVSLGEMAEQVPKPAQKAFDKAMELRGKRKLDAALKSFNEAIRIYPGYFRALAERGHLLIAMQHPSDAKRDFARALQLNPDFGPALRGAGMCEFQEGRFAQAVETLTRASDKEPGNATDYLFIGIADAALDRRDQARSALLKALSIDPVGSARAHIHLANLWVKEGNRQEAIKDIEAYLSAAPKAPDADHFRKILAQLQTTRTPG